MTMEHGLYLGTRSRTRPDTRKAMVGALKAGLIVMAVFADRIAPYSYDESVPGSRKKPPSVRFMGTDNIGRDMWSRAVRHARRLSTAGRRQDSKPWAHPAHHGKRRSPREGGERPDGTGASMP